MSKSRPAKILDLQGLDLRHGHHHGHLATREQPQQLLQIILCCHGCRVVTTAGLCQAECVIGEPEAYWVVVAEICPTARRFRCCKSQVLAVSAAVRDAPQDTLELPMGRPTFPHRRLAASDGADPLSEKLIAIFHAAVKIQIVTASLKCRKHHDSRPRARA